MKEFEVAIAEHLQHKELLVEFADLFLDVEHHEHFFKIAKLMYTFGGRMASEKFKKDLDKLANIK